MLKQKKAKYDILLPQFEGPFDLLLFFIERDELDIYDIPIAQITQDFLHYIHEQEQLNIELSSDFMLFASRLIQIKVRTLFPRKELDEQGNEIDPRQDFINQLIAYKQFKEIAAQLSKKEAERIQMIMRGNVLQELNDISKKEAEEQNSELHTLTMTRLVRAFEKALHQLQHRVQTDHIVKQFNYKMEDCKEQLSTIIAKEKRISFDRLFKDCKNKIHAIFFFLSMLEIVQLSIANILIGEGRNNFVVEYNDTGAYKPTIEQQTL